MYFCRMSPGVSFADQRVSVSLDFLDSSNIQKIFTGLLFHPWLFLFYILASIWYYFLIFGKNYGCIVVAHVVFIWISLIQKKSVMKEHFFLSFGCWGTWVTWHWLRSHPFPIALQCICHKAGVHTSICLGALYSV